MIFMFLFDGINRFYVFIVVLTLTGLADSQHSLPPYNTKTEPYRKYVARDEKSEFFIFFPEIAYGKPRNVV